MFQLALVLMHGAKTRFMANEIMHSDASTVDRVHLLLELNHG